MLHYRVQLLQEEVAELSTIISKGSHSTRTLRNAFILLNCDEGGIPEKSLTNNWPVCFVLANAPLNG